jgi:hypothetical protein
MKNQKLTPERRASLQRQRDRLKRMGEITTELLALFTEDTGLPPLPLPHDFDGWTMLRYDVGRLVTAIDVTLTTVEGKPTTGRQSFSEKPGDAKTGRDDSEAV